jgi:anti-sigma regulatory factor (Ser/Thr protein kinase)
MLVVPEELDLTLPPRPESVAVARRAVSEVLEGLDDRTQDGVRVIVSELVTNALKHGPDRPIALRIWRDGESIRGEVEDEGGGKIQIWREGDRGSEGGYGLPIVDAMSDRWGVYDGNTRVWFELVDRPA